MRFDKQVRRREALKLAAMGMAGAMCRRGSAAEWPVKPGGVPFGGLKAGITSYTTRKLSLDETIATLQRLGVRYISLKSFHLPMESSKEERIAVGRKIADAGLTLLGCGVISLPNDEKRIRAAFEYCRDVGSPTAVVGPERAALGAMDRVIKDFGDLRVAIHNHGPEDENFPSPTGAFKAIQGLDERIGCCVDVGHTLRLAEDPVAALKAVAPRLYDVHLKDLAGTGVKPHNVPLGRGVIDCAAILRTLVSLNYSGHAALEWEGEEEDPIPGMAESFGFIRGVFSAG